MYFSDITTAEWIGYAATLVLLISFTMPHLRFLRIVNSIACLLFIIYGFMILSWPVIISNTAIFGIHLYYLILKKNQ